MDLSSWWSRLAANLAVYGRIDFVSDIDTDAKRAMRPNTFGIPFPFLPFSRNILLCLNTENRRFLYFGIRWEECEGTFCSSPIGEAIVAVSRVTSVVFFTLLEWLTW